MCQLWCFTKTTLRFWLSSILYIVTINLLSIFIYWKRITGLCMIEKKYYEINYSFKFSCLNKSHSPLVTQALADKINFTAAVVRFEANPPRHHYHCSLYCKRLQENVRPWKCTFQAFDLDYLNQYVAFLRQLSWPPRY